MTASVYHIDYDTSQDRDIYLDIRFAPNEEKIKQALQANMYKKVAEVASDNLEKVFELTNSIDNYWGENAGVTLVTQENRSTSVGDIVELEGKVHVVAMMGYKQLSDDVLALLPQKKTKKYGL